MKDTEPDTPLCGIVKIGILQKERHADEREDGWAIGFGIAGQKTMRSCQVVKPRKSPLVQIRGDELVDELLDRQSLPLPKDISGLAGR